MVELSRPQVLGILGLIVAIPLGAAQTGLWVERVMAKMNMPPWLRCQFDGRVTEFFFLKDGKVQVSHPNWQSATIATLTVSRGSGAWVVDNDTDPVAERYFFYIDRNEALVRTSLYGETISRLVGCERLTDQIAWIEEFMRAAGR